MKKVIFIANEKAMRETQSRWPVKQGPDKLWYVLSLADIRALITGVNDKNRGVHDHWDLWWILVIQNATFGPNKKTSEEGRFL